MSGRSLEALVNSSSKQDRLRMVRRNLEKAAQSIEMLRPSTYQPGVRRREFNFDPESLTQGKGWLPEILKDINLEKFGPIVLTVTHMDTAIPMVGPNLSFPIAGGTFYVPFPGPLIEGYAVNLKAKKEANMEGGHFEPSQLSEFVALFGSSSATLYLGYYRQTLRGFADCSPSNIRILKNMLISDGTLASRLTRDLANTLTQAVYM